MLQENLLEVLLELPMNTMDEKLYLLAGKILLYYAENRPVCYPLNTYSIQGNICPLFIFAYFALVVS